MNTTDPTTILRALQTELRIDARDLLAHQRAARGIAAMAIKASRDVLVVRICAIEQAIEAL